MRILNITSIQTANESGSVSSVSTVLDVGFYSSTTAVRLGQLNSKHARGIRRGYSVEFVEKSRFGLLDYVREGEIEYACTGLLANWAGLSKTVEDADDAIGLQDVTQAIEVLYKWEHDKKGRMASAYAVHFVESNFSKLNLSAVNSLLLNISPEKLTEWSMVALLRSSFSARSALPAWAPFHDSVRQCLKESDRLEKLLVGLTSE